ncbi:MAG: molybdate ABC transporter substrate-binding protein [Rickettsiales bacterium]|nr:molybdate ABC transporter substrate-binding protein [Rickettsiales bacterium]
MGTALTEIARNYAREHNVVTNTAFTASTRQEQEIKEGGSADVLITPKLPWIETMKTQGLVDVYSQIKVAKNRVALVGPLDSPLRLRDDDGFPATPLIREMAGEQLFMVGNPETLLEGVYGKEALRNLEVSEDLGEYTLYVKHLDEMFDMVRKNRAYGIFFYSSTASRDGVRVLQLLPESSHHPIEYYGVAIAGENMDEARKFLDYLKTSSARRVLRENGFFTE